MRKIAIINFKGGVGKTTITWLLGKYVSQALKKRVLLFDIDAQMSLTQALTSDEEGAIDAHFRYWQKACRQKNMTISNAWEKFVDGNRRFDFDVDNGFIYTELSNSLHFVPAVEGLYYHEIVRIIDPNIIRHSREFITQLINKIEKSEKLTPYDYILFDCPPSLSILSFSVLQCVDTLIIPINPDFFAINGLGLLLKDVLWELRNHGIFEHSVFPKIYVLMNKAQLAKGSSFTKETNSYFLDAKSKAVEYSNNNTFIIECLDNFLRDSVSIKRVFRNDLPYDVREQLNKICDELSF
ncbi:ParA family protein [Candidatus Magnetobacterium casense]|uniref:ParA family protein n=1 Tax=Candidatus Magnetobacterium casense TaxID=1455061 RepID=UPI00058BA799|nr:ParA family protein [Candidatus Magnetobacterium casensis]